MKKSCFMNCYYDNNSADEGGGKLAVVPSFHTTQKPCGFTTSFSPAKRETRKQVTVTSAQGTWTTN